MHKIICWNGDKTQFLLISLLIQLKTVIINIEKLADPVQYVTLSSINLKQSSSYLKSKMFKFIFKVLTADTVALGNCYTLTTWS